MTTPLSNDEKRAKLAETCGMYDRWTVMKRGYYYRPKANGYTSCISEAWILPEAEAKKHEYPHDDPVTIHRAPLPAFEISFDACALLHRSLSAVEREEFAQALFGIITGEDVPSESRLTISWEECAALMDASPEQICNAYAKVKGLW